MFCINSKGQFFGSCRMSYFVSNSVQSLYLPQYMIIIISIFFYCIIQITYYFLDYKDRSIISAIYDSVEDLAVEIVEEFYNIPDILKNYIDYDSFGDNELLENEEYIKLSDDRIARLSC